MGYINSNLSFRAHPTEIVKGRALKLSSDGTVKHITSIADPIIGWSMEDVPAEGMVSVTTMTEGTIYAEVANGKELFAGQIVVVTDTGQIEGITSSAVVSVNTVDLGTPEQVTFTISPSPNWLSNYWLNYFVSIQGPTGHPRRGTYYKVLGNDSASVTFTTLNVPNPLTNWTLPMQIRIIRPMIGFCLEYVQESGTDKKYAEVLMLRQLSQFDRQPY